MRETRRRHASVPALPILLTIAALLAAGELGAQLESFESVEGKEPIPREGFKTWSLFLVTNQRWLVPDNAGRLRHLYDRSGAFGRVIGKDHLAVWFWKRDRPLHDPALADNVDVERAVNYCRKLRLKPSGGPYLLFTAMYPDESTAPISYTAIGLGGRSADEIERMLLRLGDQLVAEGVVREGEFQAAPGTDDFWSAWFDATRHALAELGSGFRFVIRTPSFTIESGG